jgi:hypothetical protein
LTVAQPSQVATPPEPHRTPQSSTIMDRAADHTTKVVDQPVDQLVFQADAERDC